MGPGRKAPIIGQGRCEVRRKGADWQAGVRVAVTVRIGILGGTFDPVHLGHLAIAEEAREALVLDEIVFVPAGRPYFKAERDVTAGGNRVCGQIRVKRRTSRVTMVVKAVHSACGVMLSPRWLSLPPGHSPQPCERTALPAGWPCCACSSPAGPVPPAPRTAG